MLRIMTVANKFRAIDSFGLKPKKIGYAKITNIPPERYSAITKKT